MVPGGLICFPKATTFTFKSVPVWVTNDMVALLVDDEDDDDNGDDNNDNDYE